MPLEEKLRAVPHLKALTSGLEPLSGYGHDSTFTHYYTLLKTTHLLHKQAKWWFIVKVAVKCGCPYFPISVSFTK